MRETEKKEGLMISPSMIKFTYLFDLPTLFAYFSMSILPPFFNLIFHVFDTLNTMIHAYCA